MLSFASHSMRVHVFTFMAVVLAGISWTVWAQQIETPLTKIPQNGASVPVRAWLVSGEFPSPRVELPPSEGPTGAGFNTDFLTPLGGESAAQPHPGVTVAAPDEKKVTFTPHEWDKAYIDLSQLSKTPRDVCVYLYAELDSSVDQVVYVHVGTNSAGKVWIGGQLIVSHPGDRVAMPSQHVVRVPLKAGRTPVLLKIDHDGGAWGAFFEVYGQNAQAEYCKKNFPRQFTVAADNYLPVPGATVSLRITDWVPSEPPVSVKWELVDGGRTERLDFTTPNATVMVREGPERVLVVRVKVPNAQKGDVTGECVLLTGGDAAARHTLERFEAARNAAVDLETFNTQRRDAYAQALYRFERLTRVNSAPNVTALSTDDAKNVVLLRTALDSLDHGLSPYRGKTGLFEGAYLAEADGTAQPFMLSVPRSYNASHRCALLVYLHGAGQTHEAPNSWWQPAADAPYSGETLGVAVLGRGRHAGYVGLAECDVLDVIEWAKSRYSIDSDRVYLIGSSMGGGGTWRLAAQYPDRFAAAMADCGYVYFPLLPNLLHVPFYANHGEADTSVPVTWSRLGTRLLADLGSPVVYTEYPGVDHAVGIPVTAVGYMTRLDAHRRITEPDHLRIHAEHPRYARMYWGTIVEWDDPHAPATLDASILPGNVVSVNLTNVAKACVKPPSRYLSATGDVTWLINRRRAVVPRSVDGVYDLVNTDGEMAVRPHADEPLPGTRPYVQGSYMELYRGEPLLIVYGTTARDTAVLEKMQSMGQNLSRMSLPGRQMEFGRIPTVSDTGLTDKQIARNNLFLIGGPEENAVTRRFMSRMPIREEGGKLAVFDFEPMPLAGCGYAFVYPNPEHPDRLIFVYASQEASYYAYPAKKESEGAGIFGEFWRDPFIPDLSIEKIDTEKGNRFLHLLRFTHDWRPEPGDAAKVSRHPASEREYHEMIAETCRRATGASYVLSPRGSADKPCPYDTTSMTWQDIAVLLANQEMIVLEVSGKQLIELTKPKKGVDWAVRPDPSSDTIDPDAQYRLAGPSDLIWGFGSATLAVSSRSRVGVPDLFDAAAREVWQVKK